MYCGYSLALPTKPAWIWPKPFRKIWQKRPSAIAIAISRMRSYASPSKTLTLLLYRTTSDEGLPSIPLLKSSQSEKSWYPTSKEITNTTAFNKSFTLFFISYSRFLFCFIGYKRKLPQLPFCNFSCSTLKLLKAARLRRCQYTHRPRYWRSLGTFL